MSHTKSKSIDQKVQNDSENSRNNTKMFAGICIESVPPLGFQKGRVTCHDRGMFQLGKLRLKAPEDHQV